MREQLLLRKDEEPAHDQVACVMAGLQRLNRCGDRIQERQLWARLMQSLIATTPPEMAEESYEDISARYAQALLARSARCHTGGRSPAKTRARPRQRLRGPIYADADLL